MKGYSGESRFYFGDELRNHLRDLTDGATKVDIATAWVSNSSALKLLVSQTQRHAGIRMVVGVGLFATDPAVLKWLGSTEGIELRVHGSVEPPLFHPKLYAFQYQHWHRTLIGSMNFTNAGTTTNIESVLSFEDKLRTGVQEFERFWKSPLAVPLDQFDLTSYEAKRRSVLADVKNIGATDVLEVDVAATADSHVQVDALREGWKEYVAELKAVPEKQLEDYRRVLAVRTLLVNRNWSADLDKAELDIMFGIDPYYAFGHLAQLKQNQSQFQGTKNTVRRHQIGEAIKKATTLQGFQRPMVEGIVKQLLDVPYCGAALATRLLVLARPDFFVVVNQKSFKGLQERFSISVSDTELTPRTYVDLLEKIQKEKWFQSPEPEDPSEREFWKARAALLDPLVYRETSTTTRP